MLASFHKAGYGFVQEVAGRCLPESVTLQYGVQAGAGQQHTTLIVRDAFHLATSAYFYHKGAGERWLTHKAMKDCKHTVERGGKCSPDEWNNDEVLKTYMRDGESYQAFLQRVPMKIGVRAEYLRSRRELQDIMRDVQCCQASHTCTTVCLESFMASSTLYNQTWFRILKAMELDTASLMPCLSQADFNSPNFQGFESFTGNTSWMAHSEANETKVGRIMKTLDGHMGNGRLANISNALKCGPAKARTLLVAHQKRAAAASLYW